MWNELLFLAVISVGVFSVCVGGVAWVYRRKIAKFLNIRRARAFGKSYSSCPIANGLADDAEYFRLAGHHRSVPIGWVGNNQVNSAHDRAVKHAEMMKRASDARDAYRDGVIG